MKRQFSIDGSIDVDGYENKVAAALHLSESGNKARVGKEVHRKDGRKDTSR
jgi:hypothetical protein